MPNLKNTSHFIIISLMALMALFAIPSHAETPYTVTDGKSLDSDSYLGYTVFRRWCARCHGTFGQGGPKAPDLSKSLATLSLEDFTETVRSGNVPKARQTTKQGRMPAQGRRQAVMKNIDNIYSYLKARSDGAIGKVRPKLRK